MKNDEVMVENIVNPIRFAAFADYLFELTAQVERHARGLTFGLVDARRLFDIMASVDYATRMIVFGTFCRSTGTSPEHTTTTCVVASKHEDEWHLDAVRMRMRGTPKIVIEVGVFHV